MYTILICDDNSLMTTKRERIMQRSKLTENLQFLTPKFYNDLDMSDYTVQLEYILPCSRKYCTEILSLSKEMYKDHLRYLLPFDTKLTSEAGEIELQLTFVKTELTPNGKGIQRVRKTSTTTIEIVPISAWSDIVPDSALSALDERLIKMDAQMRAMNDFLDVMDNSKVDNLVYDESEDTLQLSASGIGIGNKISIKNILDDGVPIIDLNSNSNSNSGENTDEDDNHNNDGCNCGCNCEDDVVEFGHGNNVNTPELPKDESDVVLF